MKNSILTRGCQYLPLTNWLRENFKSRTCPVANQVYTNCLFNCGIYDIMNDCASFKPKATSYDLEDSIADTDDEQDREDEYISASDQA